MILPQIEITQENYQTIAKRLEVLSNKLHLKILLILEQGPKTNEQIFSILKQQGLIKFPGSSYKAIEKLVRYNIAQKKYEPMNRRFVYFL